MKTLKVRFHIGRVFGGNDEDCVRFIVTDELSSCQIIDVRMSQAVFAEALFSREVEGTALLNDSEKIGKKIEHKTELCPFPGYGVTPEKLGEYVKEFEVDGWKAQMSDLTNYHRYEGKDKVRVTFYRWVDAEEDKDGSS